MPLRGRLHFRTGIDIVRMYRLKQMCSTSKDAYRRFLRKVFTFKELAAIQRGGRLDGATRYQFLASRWAAKEAVIKSIPRKVYMRDIEIYTRPSGSPFAVVLDRRDVDIDGVLERWAAEDGEPEAERAQREKQEASARQSERDRTKGEDLESETLTQTKPRYPPGGHGLRGEPEDLEVDGQYVDLSITHDGDYCVAVAVARSEK